MASLLKLVPPSLSMIYARCAFSYECMGRTNDAVNRYKICLRRSGSKADQLTAYTHLGDLLTYGGKVDEATRMCYRALELAIELDDCASLYLIHGNLGNIYLTKLEVDKALDHCEKSLNFAKKHVPVSLYSVGHAHNKLGICYLFKRTFDEAEKHFELALSCAIHSNDILGQARVNGNIGNVHLLCGNYQKAMSQYKQALSLSTALSVVCSAFQHNIAWAKHQWDTQQHSNIPSALSLKMQSFMLETFQTIDNTISAHLQENSGADLKMKSDIMRMLGYCLGELYSDVRELPGSHNDLEPDISILNCLSIWEENTKIIEEKSFCANDHGIRALEISMVRKLLHSQHRKRTCSTSSYTREDRKPLNFDALANFCICQNCPVVYLSSTQTKLNVWLFVHYYPGAAPSVHVFQYENHVFCKPTNQSSESCFSEHDLENNVCFIQAQLALIAPELKSILAELHFNQTFVKGIAIFDSAHDSVNFFLDLKSGACIQGSSRNYSAQQQISISIDFRAQSCVIGDPNIPPYILNGQSKIQGLLPYAAGELSFVSQLLNCKPIKGSLATKQSFLHHLKTVRGVIHIATRGDDDGSSLAFTPSGTHISDSSNKHVQASSVLLYPEEVEKLKISPALVVLSSCDSGRGIVKADGIQGMARAFILAGAQSVLTTLWKIPDESASVFMQFFYTYLADGFSSSVAIEKTIFSMLSFKRYKMPVHWNGYQLIGQETVNQAEIQNTAIKPTPARMGRLPLSNPFSSLDHLGDLEKCLLESSVHPTNVQMVIGTPDEDPSEVVIKFLNENFSSFSEIFWINITTREMVQCIFHLIEKDLNCKQNKSVACTRSLFVLGVDDAPILEEILHSSIDLLRLLKQENNHLILILTKSSRQQSNQIIDICINKLNRHCSMYEVKPLSPTQSKQRIVHSLIKEFDFIPTEDDRQMIEDLAESTHGSPPILDIAAKVLIKSKKEVEKDQATSRILGNNSDLVATFVHELLTKNEQLLLQLLSLLGTNPIPTTLVTDLANLLYATEEKLLHYNLLRVHPSPVIHSSNYTANSPVEQTYISVPSYVCTSVVKTIPDLTSSNTFMKDFLINIYSTKRDPIIRGLISLVEDEDIS